MENDLKALVGSNEKIMYEGRPNKKCFLFESFFNPLLPFALIWGIVDIAILGTVFAQDESSEMLGFIIPFCTNK
mgnify:CR=1 FL=1